MSKDIDERSPAYEFTENGQKVRLIFTMSGLAVSKIPCVKGPKNAEVIRDDFSTQSFHLCIQVMVPGKRTSRYTFKVNRLPSEIDPAKCKITYKPNQVDVVLFKKEAQSWRPYADDDFETEAKN